MKTREQMLAMIETAIPRDGDLIDVAVKRACMVQVDLMRELVEAIEDLRLKGWVAK